MRFLLSLVLLMSACVSSGTYNRKVAELTKARDNDTAAAKQRERALNEQIAALKKSLGELQVNLAEIQSALGKTSADKTTLQKQLDEGTALAATMKQRLEKLGQNVENLAKEKGELTQAKAAAEARAQTFRDLVAKLRSMIDTGQLKVAIRNGRMLIALPNDILFDSGQTQVKPDGKAALAKVAQVLRTVGERDFLVAGHTDNVPIRTALFPSNWELSTRRAVEVVHILIAQGMNPKVLAAAGYGEFDPAAANDTTEHRAQNRRIEIVLQPNLSDLPPLEDPGATTTAPAPKPN